MYPKDNYFIQRRIAPDNSGAILLVNIIANSLCVFNKAAKNGVKTAHRAMCRQHFGIQTLQLTYSYIAVHQGLVANLFKHFRVIFGGCNIRRAEGCA